jgi:hypothetical protein
VSVGIGGQEGYWTDYMAGERRGQRPRRVLDGLHGGVSVGVGGQEGYWADYMAVEHCGRGQCRVLDGLLGG